MKKTVIAVLALVLMLSLSLVVFVGCNKDNNTEPAKASNAETLGTAVAVAANYAAGGAASSAETEDNGSFKAGIDLSVNAFGLGGTIGATAEGAFDVISQIIEPMVASGVNSVSAYLNENGVTVGEVNSDDENYSKKYAITVKYVDEATGEETTEEYALYVNVAEGVEIEGKTSYDYSAKIVLSDSFNFAFDGTATYNTEKDTMVFVFDLNVAGLASVDVSAYATARGGIVIELGADVAGVVGAKVTVEVGKLESGAYGAEIIVTGKVTVANVTSVDVTIKVNATGAYDNATHSFNLGGKLDATVVLPILGTYNANADLSGKAQYNSDEDALEIGLSGTINLTKVEEDAE